MTGLGWPAEAPLPRYEGRSGLGWPVQRAQGQVDAGQVDAGQAQVTVGPDAAAAGSDGAVPDLPVWAHVAVLPPVAPAEPIVQDLPESAGSELAQAPDSRPVDNVSVGASSAPLEAVVEESVGMTPSDPAQTTLLPAAPDEAARRIRALLEDRPAPGALEQDGDETPIGAAAMAAVRVRNPQRDPFPRPSGTRTICISNQKGGVGKTTSTVNLAVALALHGAQVLVIDLDPQGNASTGLGVEHHSGVPDVYDVLINGSALADVAQPTPDVPGCWCVPATIDLAGAEIELVSVVAREWRLQRAIEAYLEGPGAEVDYVVVDCPPSLGLLTVNAMVAAQELLIPIQCEYYALEGLGQLLRTVEMVRAHLNPSLALSTILLTMYDARTKLADQVAAEVRGHFGEVVLSATIPRSVRVSEAPGYGKSVVAYDPGSRGALAYVEAAREIATRGAPGSPAVPPAEPEPDAQQRQERP